MNLQLAFDSLNFVALTTHIDFAVGFIVWRVKEKYFSFLKMLYNLFGVFIL